MVEKLRGITNWQTVVTLCFYFGCVMSLAIVGVVFSIEWLAAAGAATLGIALGSVTTKVTSAAAAATTAIGNPTSLEELKKDINDLRISMANLASETLHIKNCLGELNGNE